MAERDFNDVSRGSAPEVNPYQAPGSAAMAGRIDVVQGRGGLIESLRKTRPWVLFLGILGLIGAGFMLLGLIAIIAAPEETGVPREFAWAYLIALVFVVLPAALMLRYATAIKHAVSDGGSALLEQALDAQKSFWQVAGVLAILWILVYVGMAIYMVTLGEPIMPTEPMLPGT